MKVLISGQGPPTTVARKIVRGLRKAPWATFEDVTLANNGQVFVIHLSMPQRKVGSLRAFITWNSAISRKGLRFEITQTTINGVSYNAIFFGLPIEVTDFQRWERRYRQTLAKENQRVVT